MWKEKGQNIIEYALMLALVVGIGSFIYTQGYGDNISAVFNNAGSLLEQVNKSQEEAKEEAEKAAAREADRNYADYLGRLLMMAVSKETIQLGNGSSVSIFVQNQPNPKYAKYGGLYMNGAYTGSDVKVNGEEYIKNGGLNFIWSLAFRTFDAVGELTSLTGTTGLLRPNLLYKNSLMM